MIRLSDLIKNPVFIQKMPGKLFLFDKESSLYAYSGLLSKFYHNSETEYTKLEFRPPKGTQLSQTECKGGKVTITGNKNLKLLFQDCEAVIGKTVDKSFFVNCSI